MQHELGLGYCRRMMTPVRLHIVGASGSGTTTLGRMLAAQYDLVHLDTDDFFWEQTDPPYTTKRPEAARLRLLQTALAQHSRWVLSGSLCGWGDPLIPLFDAVIFVTLPSELRLARTLRRERERYGEQIEKGGPIHQSHLEFMAWSAQYDAPIPTAGRNRQRHEEWLAALRCPVIRVENSGTEREMLEQVVSALGSLPKNGA